MDGPLFPGDNDHKHIGNAMGQLRHQLHSAVSARPGLILSWSLIMN